ncbi:hypothetical protein CAEBREN_31470 [Caenorhabditis brenneri]|uniref:Integrase catalytic domain-containing protein n=1 Tax=Caenorhabditis brenneri TaxID=135651 RepID=G0MUT0_CAEBE|nr:hypothetical protein CAEBREN_31470 [Caenorhabditis brenneri]
MWFLIHLPLVCSVAVLTKTEPSVKFDVFNIPEEDNLFGNFVGYTLSGKPILSYFRQIENRIIDNKSNVYKINETCTFDLINNQDLLMHCDDRLLKISSNETRLLEYKSNLFTYDHVEDQIYLWRDPYIFQYENSSDRRVWKFENLIDFNIVGGLLTVLFENGTISHNDTVIAIVDPSTQSGKTTLVRKILENIDTSFDTPIDNIFWFYGVDNDGIPKHLPKITCIEGIPDVEFLKQHRYRNNIIVLDDLMNIFARDKKSLHLLNDLFCVYAHHFNCAIFNLVQSAFTLPPTTRNNSTYLILMRNLSDASQIKHLLMQQFGEKWRDALQAYQAVMSKPYNSMLINNDPNADSNFRIMENFLDEFPIILQSMNDHLTKTKKAQVSLNPTAHEKQQAEDKMRTKVTTQSPNVQSSGDNNDDENYHYGEDDVTQSDSSLSISPAISTPEQPSTDTPLGTPVKTKPVTRQTNKVTVKTIPVTHQMERARENNEINTENGSQVPVKRFREQRLPPIPHFGKVHKFLKPHGITRVQVEKILENIEAYTKHKPVRFKFPRLKTTASGIENSIQADLADVSRHKQHNDGVTFLLVCVDVYSRMFYVVPLKSKHGVQVAEAFEKIFSKFKAPPIYVYTDFGKEFYNTHVKRYFESLSIRHCTPKSEIKCAMAERANRTLKARLAKYMTFKYNWRYIDVLQKVVNAINHSINRSIKTAPVNVENGDFTNVDTRTLLKRKYKVGDHVRIYAKQGTFDKGYEERWTQEVFVIKQIYPTNPVTYLLMDQNGEEIDGKFYYYEMTRVLYDKNQVYRIDKILKKRKYSGKKQVLVQWEGMPTTFNSWVDESEIMTI